MTTTPMCVVLTGVVSKITENFEDVAIRNDSEPWLRLRQLARTKFGAHVRLEEHSNTGCACNPKLVGLSSPRVGHYAIISRVPIHGGDVDDVVEAYVRFFTPQLARLVHFSVRSADVR